MTELASTGAGNIAVHTNIRRFWLLALSFMGGFQIMTLEICGFRVLQINLGSSVVVTGTLLTTIMVVLSAGYYLGGILSQLRSLRALLLLLLGACVYTHLASVLWLERISDLGLDLREQAWDSDFLQVGIPAGVVSLLLYAPPVLALSMISPCLIHLESTRDHAAAGKKSGFFMALSTVGSILGTLLASYVLIPFFGARTTAAASNGVLFALLLCTWLDFEQRAQRSRRLQRAVIAVSGVGLALFGWLLPAASSHDEQTVVHDSDSIYGHIRVVSDTDSRGHPFLGYLATRLYRHSMVYPSEPLRELIGTFYIAPALASPTPPRELLVLGSAAGGMLRHTELLLPETHVIGVDIDPAIHEVAVKIFGVNPKNVSFVSQDARQFIEQARQTYDFIVVDLFAGEFLPAHCITKQFFAAVKQHLSPHGAVFINTNMHDVSFELPSRDSEPFRANRHLESTLREAGFVSLFENRFFHSLVAYPAATSLDALRTRWLELAQRDGLPDAARAALGLMAYTTVSVAPTSKPYRAYTDAWAPDMLIERKTNERALYRALAEAAGQSSARVAAHSSGIRELVLSRLLTERADSPSPGELADVPGLLRALDQRREPLAESDLEQAARYFQFGYEDLGELHAERQWARLGAGYARIYAAGRANDYEALLPALEELHALRHMTKQTKHATAVR